MHYTIKISDESKLTSNKESDDKILEYQEDNKSSSSDESSLVTEEDTSGNVLPPEILKIHQRNKLLQKELTKSIMNFKSSSRSILNSSPTQNFEDFQYNSQRKNPVKDVIFNRKVLIPDNSRNSNHEKLKNLLEQIIKLQSDYEDSKKELHIKEEEIFSTENEYLCLKSSLKNIEDELRVISSQSINTSCGCNII